MIDLIYDAITSKSYQKIENEHRDPIVVAGKPPVFTESAYFSFLQGSLQGIYEVATADPYASADKTKDITFPKLFSKLEGFKELKDGWDKDGAESPNSISIEKSQEILDLLYEADLIPTNISPSVEGGVSLYFIKDNKYADIECFNSGEVLTSKSDRINQPEVTELKDENDVRAFIENIKSFLND